MIISIVILSHVGETVCIKRCGGGVSVSSSCYKNLYPSGWRGGLVGKLCKCRHLHSHPSIQVKRQAWKLVCVIPELGDEVEMGVS